NIDGIKKKNENLSIKLATGIESAGLAKKLATIVTDAPITLDLEHCIISDRNKDLLAESFKELGFKSLLNRASNNNSLKPETQRPQNSKKKENKEQLGLL
ncbi:MAG: hypothetical protein M1268_02620, partial [Patescibacteria group bacterium]|nr:hypothetical protein [Patescibacteria group bacterium]